MREQGRSRVDTAVVGGGQAGLAVGYHLARRERDFVILDASQRIGDAWRGRWDSLRLFTPARYNGLPGLPFPGSPSHFPTKDEVADYLQAYAARFELPVRSGVRVERLSRNGERFLLTTRTGDIEASNVVVAMSSYQKPRVPPFARDLDPAIVGLHSSEYRNPDDLPEGDVLVVGASDSGGEIAFELSRTRRTWLSGRSLPEIPFRIEGQFGRLLGVRAVIGLAFHHVLTVDTPPGRRMRRKALGGTGPNVRVREADLAAAGVERVPRVVAVRDGLPQLEDGRTVDVPNVVWCTGFRPDFDWIDLEIFGSEEHPKEPDHRRGIVEGEPGLYFVGLFFLYALSSSLLRGVGRDAERIVAALEAREMA